MQAQIYGNQALLITPMKEDGSVDEKSLRNLIDFVISGDPHGILVMGSTGEFFSLTPEEQERIIKITAEHVDKRTILGFGAANTSSKMVARVAEQAERCGADYLLVPPPYYAPSTFGTETGVYSFFREIASSTGVEIMLYDGGSGIEISLSNLGKLAADTKNIKHVKVNVAKPAKIVDVQRLGLQAFCGLDPITMPMMRYGADGFTLGVGSLIPRESSTFFDDCKSDNWSSANSIYYEKMMPLINATLGYYPEFIAAFKLILHWMGIIETPTVRAPLVQIGDVRQKELRDVAVHCGLLPR